MKDLVCDVSYVQKKAAADKLERQVGADGEKKSCSYVGSYISTSI